MAIMLLGLIIEFHRLRGLEAFGLWFIPSFIMATLLTFADEGDY